jgi:DNA polymerase-3 subunit epsilon/exodeoxyribonuclease X
MINAQQPWHAAELVALDLEGSGAQDRDQEAILEIAVVPLAAGQPVVSHAYTSLVNPGRPVPMRPWISPGLTDATLRAAPPIADLEPDLAARVNGRYLVGHNIGVDWRLLHRHCPTVNPAGLVDTLRLARWLKLTTGNSLTTLLAHLGLTSQVNAAAPDARPHRALWDTVGAALLLTSLVSRGWSTPPSLAELAQVAALPTAVSATADGQRKAEPDMLF